MKGLFYRQLNTEVLVRDPAKRRYNSPEAAESHARDHWEYAVMSRASYEKARINAKQSHCEDQTYTSTVHATLPGWSRWADFPSENLLDKLNSSGLHVDVWERRETPQIIAVVFEGTNATSIQDWCANLRWLLRFVPNYEDQYTVAADEVAREFYERLAVNPTRYEIDVGCPELKSADGEVVKIVTSGHSLGGGLAQYFAYAFPQPYASGGPKVSEVFAFDPSPVTGWSVVPRGMRTYNAHNLRINRIFEHGEILAYLRLVTSRLSGYSAHPSVWEYRYNFDSSYKFIENHSISILSEGLMKAAGAGK